MLCEPCREAGKMLTHLKDVEHDDEGQRKVLKKIAKQHGKCAYRDSCTCQHSATLGALNINRVIPVTTA